MAILTIAGLDPALSNLGLSKGKLDIETGILTLESIDLIHTEKTNIKTTRTNIDDVERCKQLYNGMNKFLEGVDIVCVEIPVGSQTARAMMSYGACCMLTASIQLPVIPVLPHEVKLAACNSKTATKKEMIAWVRKTYPYITFPKAESKAEHIADSVATIHAAVLTDSFKLLKNAYK